ncbi:hypothetical protein [Desulfonatronum thiodismutans]|uniref:hypothetical protein n=1 Tax=Desulfonatronum thiodismutans TaxID=159290 RepID=UPI00126939D7|nr:hypothetical protein [Desulfonatronum thiodismutans]
MRTILLGLFLGFVLLSGPGCAKPQPVEMDYIPLPVLSQVPVPTAYPLKTQPKMQAVHHWEILAEDVAIRVHGALERRVLERQFPVHVAPSGTTPFAKSFHALLITKLVERNIAVSSGFTNAMVLSFDIETIRHGHRTLHTGPGVYKALAPGVFVQRSSLLTPDGHGALVNQTMLEAAEVNVESGAYTHDLPRMEILITSSLVFEEHFLMRDSSIYYINDSEWWHYKQHALPSQPATVNYQLVDR